jgi:hypothetical protein
MGSQVIVWAINLYIFAIGAFPLAAFTAAAFVDKKRVIPVTLGLYGLVLVSLIASIVVSIAIDGAEMWQPA